MPGLMMLKWPDGKGWKYSDKYHYKTDCLDFYDYQSYESCLVSSVVVLLCFNLAGYGGRQYFYFKSKFSSTLEFAELTH